MITCADRSIRTWYSNPSFNDTGRSVNDNTVINNTANIIFRVTYITCYKYKLFIVYSPWIHWLAYDINNGSGNGSENVVDKDGRNTSSLKVTKRRRVADLIPTKLDGSRNSLILWRPCRNDMFLQYRSIYSRRNWVHALRAGWVCPVRIL